MDWFSRRILAGLFSLLFFLAAVCVVSAETPMSVEDCRKEAAAGNAEAQWQLGRRYETGNGVKQDAMRAVAQYRKAADKGHRKACEKLADYYESGKLVGKDIVLAAKYRAMSRGEDFSNADNDDELILKEILRHAGGEIDYNKAVELFKLADRLKEEPLRQIVLKASGVSLIYVGKSSIYEQNVCRKIIDHETFEELFKLPCPICHGNGSVETPCLVCHGTGRCSMSNCRNGKVIIRQTTGNSMGKCGSCDGTGKCRRCHGDGNLKTHCQRCAGKGRILSKEKMEKLYQSIIADAGNYYERKREEAAEAKRREAERERQAAFEEEQRAKGLVQYNGEWMTPGDKARKVREARFVNLISSKSRHGITFKILQVLEEGRALCVLIRTDRYGNRYLTDEIFCLLYTAAINRTIVDGEIFTNDIYWCGTYSYTTVQDAPKKVALFAIELSDAITEARRQGYDEY